MKTAQRPRPTRRKTRWDRLLEIERLEARELLSAAHVFAQFDGLLPSAADTVQIPITLAPADFTLAGGKTILGFQLKAGTSSSLDPAAVQIRQASNALVTPTFSKADLAGNTQSLVLAELTPGSYNVTLRSERGTAGAFQLCVFLAGDINGDRKADLADGQVLRMINGAIASSSAYRMEADANLDGRIDSFDYAQWRNNNGDATRINPLNLMARLDPEPVRLPDGSLVTRFMQSHIFGSTNPGANVALETASDGNFDNGSTIADNAGSFTLDVSLMEGPNTLQVRSRDGFGQVRLVTLQVTLDTIAPVQPVFDLDPASDSPPLGDGQTTFDVVTLVGQTEPGPWWRCKNGAS